MAPWSSAKPGLRRGQRKANAMGRADDGSDGTVSAKRLEKERALWISERQAELARVLERHDDLVREAFHLEKFVTVLTFDPKAAKEDKSLVFKEYQAKYDLLEKFSNTNDGGGPTRQTRRAHTERLQHLKATSSPVASANRKAAARASSSGKPNYSHNNDTIWEIISNAKAKSGRGRAVGGAGAAGGGDGGEHEANGKGVLDMDMSDSDDSLSISVGRRRSMSKGKGRALSNVSSPRISHSKHPNEVPDSDEDDDIPQSSSMPGLPAKRKASSSHTLNDDAPSRKRRKTDASHSSPMAVKKPLHLFGLSASKPNGRVAHQEEESVSTDGKKLRVVPSRISARLTSLNNTDLHSQQTIQQGIDADGPVVSQKEKAPETKSPIRRIKLLVRRPPPTMSNPRQRPQPPKHGASLSVFLSSYNTLNDRDLGEDAMEQMAHKDAALIDRIDAFRRQGRLLPAHDSLFGDVHGVDDIKLSGVEPKRALDPWDHVLHTVTAQPRGRRSNGRHIASQIANKIQAYWDGYAARKDKAKMQEEKRLRVLAKTTIKMVTSEWKKAVFHIREQERLRLEAEEMRLGHEHLDAILDQSGHILETQHVDLIRGDPSSRSSSASLIPNFSDGSDEESSSDVEEDGGGEPENEIGEEIEVVGSLDGENSDAGTSRLLKEDLVEPEGSSTSSHVVTKGVLEGVEYDSDDDFAAAIDEMMAQTRSSSPERPDITDFGRRESDSSPSTSLPLPLSPPEEPGFGEGASHDVLLAQNLESRLVDPDGRPNGIWKEIDAPAEFEVPAKPIEQVVPHNEEDVEQCDPSEVHSLEIVGGEEGTISPETPDTDLVHDNRSPPEPVDENAEQPTASTSSSVSLNDEQVIAVSAVAGDDNDTTIQGIEEMEEPPFEELPSVPDYLKPYAVAPVEWDFESKVRPPLLLRGILRPYQQSGLEWLASLHTNNLNGILADEMGLGKTIQAISLLAHLACDRGIWGPHLIVVPTSVLLNWEMEFKKFLPGFKTLSYHGSPKRRKELRQGWNDKLRFNVCITSYTLASRDAHIFKRKAWYYMILDEAHMIKNFKSQRWNILLMFRSFRRLLLTGTPLQNNLTELWALLQFLMSGANFANLKEFGDWFSNPLEKAIEMGTVLDDETLQRVSKLHTVLRPYLLRRLKRDVEKELPSKYEHLVLCPLSKRQRFLYDEFMSRAQTRDALQSGVYQKVANILMQLRKVCNHPDLFEVRPIVTSFAMGRSAIADFEIKELLIRRQLLESEEETLNLDVLGLQFVQEQNKPIITALESRRLDATSRLPFISEIPGEPPPRDTRTIAGHKRFVEYSRRAETIARWSHIGYLNRLRCNRLPVYGEEMIEIVNQLHSPLRPSSVPYPRNQHLNNVDLVSSSVKSYATRATEMADLIDKFTFVTPAVVALDMPRIALLGNEAPVLATLQDTKFDAVLHRASVKLQIAFPDPSLLQYDCGKLQELTRLLRERKVGGHRVLIFTQMTKILDILEIFLNFHGYLYLRLDGATKIEDRQYITERFNADSRIFCFIASSRSGGVGINLTGADTVVFYDSDFNPQMDRQCEDRAHRIGQIRDVHIYRFISQHTVEEAMLRKANQKRSLDDLVIQKGEFDWRSLFGDEAALSKALGEFEDTEDARAAAIAAREEVAMEGADEAEFGGDVDVDGGIVPSSGPIPDTNLPVLDEGEDAEPEDEGEDGPGEDVEEQLEGGTTVDYMLSFVGRDYEFFRDWRL